MRIPLILVAVCVFSFPAEAVNKCVGADGRAVFQDMPCADGRGEKLVIRPASGAAPAVAPAAGVTAPQAEVLRLQAQTDRLRAINRIGTLEARVIPDALTRLNGHKARCEMEFQALRARKGLANNNLAGATWEQSISSEMTAVATRCDTQSRALEGDVARFQSELADLKDGVQRP